jgi:hypothetical protein
VVALLGVDGLDFDVDVNEDECALLLLLVCIIIIIIISDVSRLVNTKEGEKKFSSFFSTLDRFSRTKRTKKSLLINSSLFSFKKEFVILKKLKVRGPKRRRPPKQPRCFNNNNNKQLSRSSIVSDLNAL